MTPVPVQITGVGLHGALGDAAETWDRLRSGQTGLRRFELPGVEGFPFVPGAPAAVVPAASFLEDRKLLKYMSPTTAMAVVAAGRALDSAGLLEQPRLRKELALFVTTSLIAFDLSAVSRAIAASRTEAGLLDLQRMGREGFRRCHPLMPFKMLLNMPLGMISIVFDIRGENGIFYPGAAQAAASFEQAFRGIATGRIERALVGGTAHGLSLLPLCTLSRRGWLARTLEEAAPHTDAHRGYAPADGAAFVVLESAAAARRRGAAALATVTSAAAGQTWRADAAGRFESWSRLWGPRLDGGDPPSLILSTGNMDAADDAAEVAAVEAAGQGPLPRLTTLDGQLGYLGAAALPAAVTAAAMMIVRDQGLPVVPRPRAARLLADPAAPCGAVVVSSTDPEGGCGVVRLDPPGGEGGAS